jgi:regulator of protease activity HflC (stomatin/prohibitin superfamily)
MMDVTTDASSVSNAAGPSRPTQSEFIKVSNMNPITAFLVFAFLVAAAATGYFVHIYLGAALFVVAVLIGTSLKMANVWQKFVILRMGKLQSVKGAGLFAIIPVLDSVVAVIDERIQTTGFNAEQALTKDTVPVNVDAIIFWHVSDAEKAALAITNYREAIDRVATNSGVAGRFGTVLGRKSLGPDRHAH